MRVLLVQAGQHCFWPVGKDVNVFDVSDTVEQDVNAYIKNAWPTLLELGLAEEGRCGRLAFFEPSSEAVKGCQFVQENVPERIDVKHNIYGQIEPHLAENAIVASSASGLMVKEMQEGWKDPSRFILCHPLTRRILSLLLNYWAMKIRR